MKIEPRKIETVNDSLRCYRDRVEFLKLDEKDERDAIRVYGGYQCATLQLRGFGSTTRHGKPIQMIATATYLDKNEVAALIAKLQEILPTLP